MSDTSVPQKRKRKRPKPVKKVPEPKKPVNTKTRSVSNSFFTNQAIWTYRQRCRLLKLLKLCPSENEVQSVYQNVPDHTPEEVEAEVNRLRNAAFAQCSSSHQLQAPIETWLDFCEELIHFEEEDHSKCLGRAMSIVANYESFEKKDDGPDYRTLYKYISAVLNHVEPPKLSPLESLVIVDLMHSLVDVLSETDTSAQRAVMKWKFSLLNCKVNIHKMKETKAQTETALANIFPEDLFKDPPGSGRSKARVVSSTTGSGGSVKEETSDQQTCTSRSRSSPPRETTLDAGEGCSSTEQNSKQTGDHSEQGEPPSKKICVRGRGKVKDKGRGQAPGPDQGQGQAPAPDQGRGQATAPDQGRGQAPAPDQGRGQAPAPDQGQGQAPAPDQGRGQSGNQDEGSFVKPQLYTLNPFCVPVNILKLPKAKRKRMRTKDFVCI